MCDISSATSWMETCDADPRPKVEVFAPYIGQQLAENKISMRTLQ